MTTKTEMSIERYFGDLDDPRSAHNTQHPLINIITIAICGVVCGADTWVDIEQFGHAKRTWLATFLDLGKGIPSHDTFGRVFRHLDPEAFQASFREWTLALCALSAGELVALDGKELRGTQAGPLGREGIRMVSAWASANRLVLGQLKVSDKSNEITALPMLLNMLDLSNSVVTLDAIGCQTDIARAIIDQAADYVIAVKGNQGTLLADVSAAFDTLPPDTALNYQRTVDRDHGRLEIRECWVNADPRVVDHIQDYKAWSGLQTLVKVVAERRVSGQTTSQTRYYITSLPPDAARLLDLVRAHWQIENCLHWVLDIAFREDDSRVRTDHAPQNFAVLRHIALNLLRPDHLLDVGVKAKRLRAGWDHDYLLRILCAGF
jgi:predicted transposase YbfD/YdcC